MGRTKEHERILRLHRHNWAQDSISITVLRASWQKSKVRRAWNPSMLDQVTPFRVLPQQCLEFEHPCLQDGFSHFPILQALSADLHNHSRYLSLVYIQCLLDSVLRWGTMMTNHVADGTLPWQFPSPDCEIFWSFLLFLKMARKCF